MDITDNVAIQNVKTLLNTHNLDKAILKADSQGRITQISKLNVFGRLANSLSETFSDHPIEKAIIGTVNKITKLCQTEDHTNNYIFIKRSESEEVRCHISLVLKKLRDTSKFQHLVYEVKDKIESLLLDKRIALWKL